MSMFDQWVGLDQPATYAVKIQGRATVELADWFQGSYKVSYEAGANRGTVTCMEGMIADQAALHGLLARIRDLGLVLLAVDCLSARSGTRSAAEN